MPLFCKNPSLLGAVSISHFLQTRYNYRMVGRDGGSRGHKRSLLDSSSTAIRNQEGSCMGGGGFLSGNSAQVHNINTTWWGKLGEGPGGA